MFRSDCLFYICKLIINMLNTTDGVEVHLDITKVYRLSLGVRRIAQIFLKPIVEKLVVFRAKMWAQMGKRVVSWETRSYFHFFLVRFQWNSADQNGGFTCFWVKSLKPVVVSLKPGVLAEASNFAKIPWFQWIPPRCFKLLYPNNTWIPPFWSAEFHWIPYQKKENMSVFPMKPLFYPFEPTF